MSELDFRTKTGARGRMDVDAGGSSAGLWLIFAGVALAVIVLGAVLGSAPAPVEPADVGPPASAATD